MKYSGAGALVMVDGCIILGKERNGGEYADFGGKRDQGENDPCLTACREMREETLGVIINTHCMVVRHGTVGHHTNPYHYFVHELPPNAHVCSEFNRRVQCEIAKGSIPEITQMLRFPIASLLSNRRVDVMVDDHGKTHKIHSRTQRILSDLYKF